MSRIASQKAETRRNITTAGLLAGLLCALALACSLLAMPTQAFAADNDYFACDGLVYRILSEEDRTAEVTSYTTRLASYLDNGKLEIPYTAYHEGAKTKYRVVAVSDGALEDHSLITSVEFYYADPSSPSGCTSIGACAFRGCTNLTSVDLGGVEDIGDEAFCRTGLRSVTIGFSVKTIGDAAFSKCSNLTSLAIGSGLTTIGDSAFSFTAIQSVTIPDNVQTLGDYAFRNCSKLSSVTLGKGIDEIGTMTFYNCDALTAIEIPQNIKIVGYAAFMEAGLTSMVIPDTVTSIDTCAFYKCESLTSVSIGSGVKEIGGSAFGYTALTALIIPDSVETIGYAAFCNCSSLAYVTIGDGVKSIGSQAFDETALSFAAIPTSVETLGDSAFNGGCKVFIIGGTMTGIDGVAIDPGDAAFYIGGGSVYLSSSATVYQVNSDGSYPTERDSSGTPIIKYIPVYCQPVHLSLGTSSTSGDATYAPITAIYDKDGNEISYGLDDTMTNIDGMAYLWLPSGTTIGSIEATSGGITTTYSYVDTNSTGATCATVAASSSNAQAEFARADTTLTVHVLYADGTDAPSSPIELKVYADYRTSKKDENGDKIRDENGEPILFDVLRYDEGDYNADGTGKTVAVDTGTSSQGQLYYGDLPSGYNIVGLYKNKAATGSLAIDSAFSYTTAYGGSRYQFTLTSGSNEIYVYLAKESDTNPQPSVSIETESLNVGVARCFYQASLVWSGSTGYTLELSGLPGTLALKSDGTTIEGLLGEAGTYSVTASVKDASGNVKATKTCTLKVESNPLASLTVTGTPIKAEYDAGESFSLDGLTVKAAYTYPYFVTAGTTIENELDASDITVSPDPLTAGTTEVTLSYTEGGVTKTATVSGITVGKATPTITWPTASSIDYGQALSQSHLTGGSTGLGTFAWTDSSQVLAAGTHSASVTFTPNDEASSTYDWTGVATAGSVSVIVEKAAPAVTLAEKSVTGDGDTHTVTLAATLSGVSGADVPTGSVTFKAGAETIGAATLENGKATCTWAASKDTVYSVTAEYTGDANYGSATSEPLSVNTARKNQTVEIAAVGGKVYGDAPFELTLSEAGSGTGAATWKSLDPDILTISGSTATILKAGKARIEVVKAADDEYNAAEDELEIEVDERALTLAAADQSMVAGEAMPNLTWKIAGGSLASGDQVAKEPSVFCTADTTAAGTYSIGISGVTIKNASGDDMTDSYSVLFSPGLLKVTEPTKTYTVTYDANGGSGASTDSNAYQAGDTVTVSSVTPTRYDYVFLGWNTKQDGSGSSYGLGDTITMGSENITLYAKWEADSKATPTITWPTASSIDYGQALSQSHLTGGSTGLGTFAWTDSSQVLAAGTHSASVTFTPNDEASSTYDWTGVATTGSVSVVVRKATPAVSVSAGEITGAGDTRTMTLTATVSGVPGAGAPTGSVAFKAGGVTIGTAELAKGTATCSWAASADTAYSVVAVYVGDANYSAARSAALGINTARSNQSIDIASVDGKVYGDAPFELTLSSAGSGTGAVTWTSSDPNIVSISGSTATIHAAGEVTITAMKAADDTYNAAEAAIDIEVDERPLTLAAANQSMVAGEDMPSLTWEVADGSLAEGDYVASADVSCAADTAAAGTHSISISGATIKNASGDDVTDSYNITYVPGTLTVEPSNEPDPEKAAQKIVGGKKVVKVKAKKATGKLAKKKAFRIGCRAKYEPKAATLTYGLKKVTVKKASGKYKKASKRIAKRIKVGKKGKVTLKKGLPKGTYKIKVRVKAKATASHAAATKVKTIKIRVK